MKTLLLKFASFALLAVPVLLIGCGEDATDEKTQGPAPVLSVKLNETNTLNVSAAGSSRITLLYEVENPVEGATVSVSSEDAWLHDFDTATALCAVLAAVALVLYAALELLRRRSDV